MFDVLIFFYVHRCTNFWDWILYYLQYKFRDPSPCNHLFCFASLSLIFNHIVFVLLQ